MGFSTTLTSAPTYIAADPKSPREILNVAGGTVYYKVTDDVDSEDTAITKGSSAQITAGSYFISATKSEVVVRELPVTNVEDITAVDDLVVGDDAEIKDKLTVVGTSTLKGAVTAEAEVEAKKALKVVEGSTLEGAVSAKKTLSVKEKLTAEAEVEAKKALKVLEASTLEGAVEAKAALTVGTTLGVTGATTPTGGVVSSGGLPGAYAGGWVPPTAESGTDTKLVEKKLFLTAVHIPANKKLKGVAILVGATGGKGKVVAALFDATGKVLAKSSETEEGTVLGTAKEIQKLAFTAEYDAVGPKTFFVGLTGNGTEEGTFRTIPSNTASDNVWTAEKELAEKCKMADFAEPPSTFTGAKGPVAMLY